MAVVSPAGINSPHGPAAAGPAVDASPAAAAPLDSPEPAAGGVAVAAAASTKAFDGLKVPGVFPLDALGSIPAKTASGQIFRLDNGFLDALRLQVRPIEADGKPGYDVQFKISGPSRAGFAERLDKLGAKKETFQFHKAEVKTDGSRTRQVRNGTHALGSSFYSHKAPNTGGSPQMSTVLTGKDWRIDFIPSDGPISLRGQVRITVSGDDAACAAALGDAIKKTGLQAAFAPVTNKAADRFARMKLLWRVAPKAAADLAKAGPLTDLAVSKIDAALKKAGVDQARVDALRYEEVAPGHFAVMDPVGLENMKQAGLRFAYSTVKAPEHVLSILTHGQKATLTRWAEGNIFSGMSSMADVGSGGAQGVFSRLVTDKATSTNTWTGRTYKIILKPDLLARTDIWGWAGDFYGRSWDLTDKNFGTKLLKDVNGNSYKTTNEIISPVGNGPQFIAHVVATTEQDRKKLLEYLKKEGYTPPKGQSLEDFVKLSPKIDPDLLG